jgi:alpha-aminoadipic semialdehyde synthase
MSIDNLPAEIPYESSVSFSKSLKPFVPGIAKADFSQDFDKCNLPKPAKKAVILYKGEFTADYKYMERFI